ncbi:MAG TPA: FixH family protein [Bryobacteraceae bacterium]
MNKYVVRTSLVWIASIACAAGIYFYFYAARKPHSAAPAGVQPAAVGTAAPQAFAARSGNPPLAPVQLSPQRMQSIGVQVGTVERKQVHDDIRATGIVQIDERLVSYVQLRFSGYIRKVFVNAPYQYVKKGEPLFTIYSPELAATQNEYLLAQRDESQLENSTVADVASGAKALKAAAKARLEQWNISQTQIDSLESTGKPITELTMDSPASGYVTTLNALPNLYVQPSTRLYTIADLSRVWVNAQVFQNDAGRLRPRDPVEITVDAYPGRTFHGRIESILPQVDEATRTVQVRLEIANPDLDLKPGMYVNADLKTNLGRHLVVPASAILQTGTQAVAFINQGGGRLIPQEVTVGPRVGDDIIVLSGLKTGQRVVTSANFLVDADSQLQAAAGSYRPPPPGAGRTAQPSRAQIQFTTNPTPPHKGNDQFQVKLMENGAPVDGADVTVRLFMPAMPAMGMSAKTAAVKLVDSGSGVYRGTATLPSGGTWQVTITARKNGQMLATKQLSFNAAGAM